MKFGQVTYPQNIDFSTPIDHPDTDILLSKYKSEKPMNVHVGCAKWNRQDLKNFYPKGTIDDLAYYSTQFNCIELNATFYRKFPPETYIKWYNRTPVNFKFFPKIIQNVSHFRRLNEQAFPVLEEYLNVTSNLQEKLGTIFLQMHSNFSPKDWDRVVRFIELWPKEFHLAIEFRHPDWINDKLVAQEMYHLLEENGVANVLVDTAGRRDLMHMRLTNNEAFIRYVGTNHKTDYDRLDDWVLKLSDWKKKGLKNIHFFIHQNMELASPLLSTHFITELNNKLDCNLNIPKRLVKTGQKLS